MWHGCYLDFMYCMVISSFPIAVFTAMWQKQFPIKKQEIKPSRIPDSCFKVWTHKILYNSDFVLPWDEFLTFPPKIQMAQQFLEVLLEHQCFPIFWGHNIRFLYPLSQQSLLYKILHYCKTVTLFVVIMPWRIFHNNYIHKSPWFEHCASFFQCMKSFLNRTVIDVRMSIGSHTTAVVVTGCLDILPTVWRLRWYM